MSDAFSNGEEMPILVTKFHENGHKKMVTKIWSQKRTNEFAQTKEPELPKIIGIPAIFFILITRMVTNWL